MSLRRSLYGAPRTDDALAIYGNRLLGATRRRDFNSFLFCPALLCPARFCSAFADHQRENKISARGCGVRCRSVVVFRCNTEKFVNRSRTYINVGVAVRGMRPRLLAPTRHEQPAVGTYLPLDFY